MSDSTADDDSDLRDIDEDSLRAAKDEQDEQLKSVTVWFNPVTLAYELIHVSDAQDGVGGSSGPPKGVEPGKLVTQDEENSNLSCASQLKDQRKWVEEEEKISHKVNRKEEEKPGNTDDEEATNIDNLPEEKTQPVDWWDIDKEENRQAENGQDMVGEENNQNILPRLLQNVVKEENIQSGMIKGVEKKESIQSSQVEEEENIYPENWDEIVKEENILLANWEEEEEEEEKDEDENIHTVHHKEKEDKPPENREEITHTGSKKVVDDAEEPSPKKKVKFMEQTENAHHAQTVLWVEKDCRGAAVSSSDKVNQYSKPAKEETQEDEERLYPRDELESNKEKNENVLYSPLGDVTLSCDGTMQPRNKIIVIGGSHAWAIGERLDQSLGDVVNLASKQVCVGNHDFMQMSEKLCMINLCSVDVVVCDLLSGKSLVERNKNYKLKKLHFSEPTGLIDKQMTRKTMMFMIHLFKKQLKCAGGVVVIPPFPMYCRTRCCSNKLHFQRTRFNKLLSDQLHTGTENSWAMCKKNLLNAQCRLISYQLVTGSDNPSADVTRDFFASQQKDDGLHFEPSVYDVYASKVGAAITSMDFREISRPMSSHISSREMRSQLHTENNWQSGEIEVEDTEVSKAICGESTSYGSLGGISFPPDGLGRKAKIIVIGGSHALAIGQSLDPKLGDIVNLASQDWRSTEDNIKNIAGTLSSMQIGKNDIIVCDLLSGYTLDDEIPEAVDGKPHYVFPRKRFKNHLTTLAQGRLEVLRPQFVRVGGVVLIPPFPMYCNHRCCTNGNHFNGTVLQILLANQLTCGVKIGWDIKQILTQVTDCRIISYPISSDITGRRRTSLSFDMDFFSHLEKEDGLSFDSSVYNVYAKKVQSAITGVDFKDNFYETLRAGKHWSKNETKATRSQQRGGGNSRGQFLKHGVISTSYRGAIKGTRGFYNKARGHNFHLPSAGRIGVGYLEHRSAGHMSSSIGRYPQPSGTCEKGDIAHSITEGEYVDHSNAGEGGIGPSSTGVGYVECSNTGLRDFSTWPNQPSDNGERNIGLTGTIVESVEHSITVHRVSGILHNQLSGIDEGDIILSDNGEGYMDSGHIGSTSWPYQPPYGNDERAIGLSSAGVGDVEELQTGTISRGAKRKRIKSKERRARILSDNGEGYMDSGHIGSTSWPYQPPSGNDERAIGLSSAGVGDVEELQTGTISRGAKRKRIKSKERRARIRELRDWSDY